MNLDQISSLFEINVDLSQDDSSDYSMKPQKTVRSFDQCCEDVKSTLEVADKLKIEDVVKPKENTEMSKSKKQDDKPKETSKIESKSKVEKKAETKSDFFDLDDSVFSGNEDSKIIQKSIAEVKTPKPEIKQEVVEEIDLPETDLPETPVSDSSNPLELSPADLEIYHNIKLQYPNFQLYNGSRAYKDFYKNKFIVLKALLLQFKILNIQALMEELQGINLNHWIDADVIHPDLVRTKINDSYKQRVRLSHILVTGIAQYPVWTRCLEMMKSKLWKDHGLKGAHNRDGLTMEHLFDMEMYTQELESFIESARHYDNILKAATDSLSRQLTCMQLKEQHGLAKIPTKADHLSLDDSDENSIESGAVISPLKLAAGPQKCNFGELE